jgi:antimicrobial peptide system SdpB family protein
VIRAVGHRLSERWEAIVEVLSGTRHRLIGAALMRVSLGACGLYFYLTNFSQRFFLWGPYGVWSWADFRHDNQGWRYFNLYALSRSPVWFSVVFMSGIVVAALFTVGWRTRLTTPLHYLFMWSILQRNPAIPDGGDNLLMLILVYLMFVDSGQYFAVGAARRRMLAQATDSTRRRVVTVLHNAGVLAIILQVCVVYWTSVMWKVQGTVWQDGTALYYILRDANFTWPGVSQLIYQHALVVTLLTYGTVFFQMAFPLLLINRTTRVVAFAGGLMLHTGIALLMGLITFSWIMISTELIVIDDRRYISLRTQAERARLALAARRAALVGAG